MKLQDDLSNIKEFENELPKSLRILWELFQNANPETYTELKEWLEIFEPLGLTFDYGLSADIYDVEYNIPQ